MTPRAECLLIVVDMGENGPARPMVNLARPGRWGSFESAAVVGKLSAVCWSASGIAARSLGYASLRRRHRPRTWCAAANPVRTCPQGSHPPDAGGQAVEKWRSALLAMPHHTHIGDCIIAAFSNYLRLLVMCR